MATTKLTKNLKLKISSDLSVDAKYNLEKIDTLATAVQVTSRDDTVIRAIGNISLLPESNDVGGTGVGGIISLGSANQPLSSFSVFADVVSVGGSDLLTSTSVSTLTNKTIAAASNTITGLTNTNIAAGASIDGSKISPLFVAAVTTPSIVLQGASFTSTLLPAAAGQSSNLSWYLPVGDGSTGQVLTTDGSGVLSWSSAVSSSLATLTDVTLTATAVNDRLLYNGSDWVNKTLTKTATWSNADGVTKTITHSFNTYHVLCQVLDDQNKTIIVAEEYRSSPNVITLTASDAPATTWTVLLYSLS